jgi:hypothetical protein
MSNCTTPVDDRERAAVDLWRKGHLCSAAIQIYLQWVRRFRAFCEKWNLDEVEQLTGEGVRRFVHRLRRTQARETDQRAEQQGSCHNALHGWSCALRALGAALPPWRVKREAPLLPPLLGKYRQFRKAHSGVSDGTLRRDIDTAGAFLALLRSRRRSIKQTRLKDVDLFVSNTAARFSTGTVADTCSSLRAFLRFLHATGRLASDLAGGVMRPRFLHVSAAPANVAVGRCAAYPEIHREEATTGKTRLRDHFAAGHLWIRRSRSPRPPAGGSRLEELAI